MMNGTKGSLEQTTTTQQQHRRNPGLENLQLLAVEKIGRSATSKSISFRCVVVVVVVGLRFASGVHRNLSSDIAGGCNYYATDCNTRLSILAGCWLLIVRERVGSFCFPPIHHHHASRSTQPVGDRSSLIKTGWTVSFPVKHPSAALHCTVGEYETYENRSGAYLITFFNNFLARFPSLVLS